MSHFPAIDSKLLYLDAQAIRDLNLAPTAVREELEAGFRQHASGTFMAQPKQTLAFGPGHFFQSLAVVSADPPYAANKWVGIASANADRGLPNVNGLIVLSDAVTGLPLAVMDANVLTVTRTAGMSALAASHLARLGSRSLGFIGCGQQAQGHLVALREVLTKLDSVLVHSAHLGAAQAFADRASELGLAARATSCADDVLACDVIVTSVAGGPALVPFLNASKVMPGCFVAAVDLGRSWVPATLDRFDLKVTDDEAQAMDPENRRKLSYQGPFDADLARLVTSPEVRRTNDEQRIIFIFPGFAVADLVLAGLAYRTALASGTGTWLPR
jgi:alanine dehydrogenase